MIITVAFAATAVVLCAATLLLMLGTANVYLSGQAAIEHDGLARGRLAPRWSLADSAGVVHTSPPARPLQLVIFADHSLKSFPSVVTGLRELIADDPDLEVVVLLRSRNDIVEPLLEMIGLGGTPVLSGPATLYADYNVRVGPFLIFVDADGRIRASSLVNHDWQVAKLRQLAGLELAPEEQARGLSRRAARGVARQAERGLARKAA
jgi:hypothetical protein